MKPSLEIERLVEQVEEFIDDLIPGARIKRETAPYSGEDARLSVYPPLSWDEEQCLEMQTQISSHTVDIHLDTGYVISVYVYMPAQQVTEAQRHLQEARAAVQAAEKILAEAQQIGLWQPQPTTPETIPA
jgi:hypothetical protein